MLPERKKKLSQILSTASALMLVTAAIAAHYILDPWGFYRKCSEEETILRTRFVETAESYLSCREADGSHRQIIDRYNSHKPLAQGYAVQYSDSWCSTFVSTVSISCGFTQFIPTECGCERHIRLFQDLDAWEENDAAIPLPGDLIFYDWNMEERGECTGWADHVGIVVGTKWPFLKVIEGNNNDSVAYQYLLLDHVQIRGYAKPDYASYLKEQSP